MIVIELYNATISSLILVKFDSYCFKWTDCIGTR